jgi:hypothetical protein
MGRPLAGPFCLFTLVNLPTNLEFSMVLSGQGASFSGIRSLSVCDSAYVLLLNG